MLSRSAQRVALQRSTSKAVSRKRNYAFYHTVHDKISRSNTRAPTAPFRPTIHLREIYCVHKSLLTQRDTRSWHVAGAGNRLRSLCFWPNSSVYPKQNNSEHFWTPVISLYVIRTGKKCQRLFIVSSWCRKNASSSE